MDVKHGLWPAALAASLFLAAPSWGAGKDDTSTNAKGRSAATASHSSDAAQQPGAQNHTQGEVNEKCLREDPRKHPADVACATLKSKRHPKMASHANSG
jgi:hypothetical protein